MGGGIYNARPSTTTLIGSTLSNNVATDRGGGILNLGYYDSSVPYVGTIALVDTTLSGNTGCNNSGGGIYNYRRRVA